MPQRPPAATLHTPGRVTHVMVPWAVSLSEHCQQHLPQLDDQAAYPRLHQLLSRLSQQQWLHGDEYALNTPHERIWAQAMGWPHGEADRIPWAAQLARTDGLDSGDQAWGLLTPCHWLMGHDHLTMLHPDELGLDEHEAQRLFEAILPLFSDDGWQLLWGGPTRWYLRHDTLSELPTASLERVLGRNPDLWMPEHLQARKLKRLQAEVQMLLYEHPINDERQARGAYPVNSFWLSGCGRWPEGANTEAPLQVIDAPRQALLRNDTAAWQVAWQTLEDEAWPPLIAQLDAGEPVRLTLCGERHALTLSAPTPQPWWQRTWQATLGRWRRPALSPSALLASL